VDPFDLGNIVYVKNTKVLHINNHVKSRIN